MRPGRKVAVGETLTILRDSAAEVLDRGEHGERTIRFAGDGDLLEEVERIGHVPLPPYIRREDRAEDRSRYQTVYARTDRFGRGADGRTALHAGSARTRAALAGADVAHVTLHVGLGTFAPLHVETFDEVRLHSERYSCRTRRPGARIRGASAARSPWAHKRADDRNGVCTEAPSRARQTSSSAPAIDFGSGRDGDEFPSAAIQSADAGERIRRHRVTRAAYRHAVSSATDSSPTAIAC